ncbi:MAG: DUF2017 family protein [Actinomycetota bacterium]
MIFRRLTFARTSSGTISVRLSERDQNLLTMLIGELRELLVSNVSADGDLPDAIRRLFPTAHPDDADAEADYRSMMRDQLLAQRLEALERVENSIEDDEIDDELADAWMGVINDMRLTIGTILDVTEDDEPAFDPEAPDAAIRFTYSNLNLLLGDLVEARMDGWTSPGDQAGNQ